jgi:PIN domain
MIASLRQATPISADVVAAVREVGGKARNLQGCSVPQQLKSQYLAFCVNSSELLGRFFVADEVDRVILTRRYWTLLGMDDGSDAVLQLLNREIAESIQRLHQLEEATTKLHDRWMSPGSRFVVADTNVYLHHPQFFDEVDWRTVVGGGVANVRLILPLLILDELDLHKRSNKQAVRIRARETLKRIQRLFVTGSLTRRPLAGQDEGLTVELLMDDLGHRRHPHNDSEIVDRSRCLADLVSPQTLKFVTGDIPMALRARNAGLDVVPLELPDRAADDDEQAVANRAKKNQRIGHTTD